MFAASKTAGASSGGINYIEDVFSTYLYTGNGSTQTITNGIDLSTKGGLVWAKARSSADNHGLYDTARGVENRLISNSTAAQSTASGVTAFNANGFSLGSNSDVNGSGKTTVSWTFRKQPKFFDVVTGTGSGTFNHNLQSVPGCIILKRTDGASSWFVKHNGLTGGITGTYDVTLNTTAAQSDSGVSFNPTSTQFTVAGYISAGETWVAYLFAHNAGGFGLTGTDNVISCGSYTGSAAGVTITLGYEPQWVLIKKTSAAGDNWRLLDVIRGMAVAGFNKFTLAPNSSIAEETWSDAASPSATGFTVNGAGLADNGDTYIYIAIRRGPMKIPTTSSSVFGLSARTGTGANVTVTGGQTADAVLIKNRGSAVGSLFSSRLTSIQYLVTSSTAAGVSAGVDILQANPWNVMNGVKIGTTNTITNASGNTFINYLFKRAPSFMDVVCYTGTGVAKTESHNLQTIPELIILKNRTNGTGVDWEIYNATIGATSMLRFNTSASGGDITYWNNTSPTTSVFSLGTNFRVNNSGDSFIAYLFSSCSGVSKVGSYTGNGSTQTIDCGFGAGGVRFVLIKRTDASGAWYIYDTARGMTTLTDPYWLTNTTAAEVATLGSVTTVSTGFALNSTILAAINENAGTYLFLAIA